MESALRLWSLNSISNSPVAPRRLICQISPIQRKAETTAYTAISRKVVGKVHATNPKGIVGGFELTGFQRNLKEWQERPSAEAVDICLRVLKESSKSRFDSYSVRNSVLIISHITFRDCRVHMFSDNLSRNSCINKH